MHLVAESALSRLWLPRLRACGSSSCSTYPCRAIGGIRQFGDLAQLVTAVYPSGRRIDRC
jgi:hypothetical protein